MNNTLKSDNSSGTVLCRFIDESPSPVFKIHNCAACVWKEDYQVAALSSSSSNASSVWALPKSLLPLFAGFVLTILFSFATTPVEAYPSSVLNSFRFVQGVKLFFNSWRYHHVLLSFCVSFALLSAILVKNTLQTNNSDHPIIPELPSNELEQLRQELDLVQNAILSKKDKYATILSKAIQLATISYDDSKLVDYQLFEQMHKLLQTSFPTVHRLFPPTVIGGYSLLYKIPGLFEQKDDGCKKLNPILFCSHMDVVPAFNEGRSWDHDPFGGEILDGVIWGRGAIDNKHNMIGQLGAIEHLLASGITLKRTVYVAIGHDEEIGGYDGAAKIAKYFKEQQIKFDFILDEGPMMVSGGIPGLQGPLAMIATSEKGLVTVEMSVDGDGGHASMPSIREESVTKVLSKAVIRLESNPMPAYFEKGNPFRTMFEWTAHRLVFPLNVICSNLWLFGPLIKRLLLRASNGAAASIRTTTAVTKMQSGSKINVLPSCAKAYVHHRVHPLDTIEEVLEHDRRTINNDRVKLRILEDFVPPSPDSGATGSGFRYIQHCVQEVFGHPSAPTLMTGNTDTRWYWDLSDEIYRFSPVALSIEDVSMFHGLNERIGITDLAGVVQFFVAVMKVSDTQTST